MILESKSKDKEVIGKVLINGININTLGVKLYDRVIKSNQIETTEAWLDGDIQPTYIRQQDKFKNITLTFLILDKNEETAFLTISKLTALLKHAVIRFDDINLDFNVNIQGYANPDRLKNGNFKVTYSLTSDYATGERETYTTDANLTNSFKLTVLYYKDGVTLLSNDTYTIRQSNFVGSDTFASIGIDLNRYQPNYYNIGAVTNFSQEITYQNLLDLNTLIVNYSPIEYNLQIDHQMQINNDTYYPLLSEIISFTQPALSLYRTIGELIDTNSNRPEGFRARIDYTGDLTVEALLLASPITVYYDQIQNERSKNIVVSYYAEDDEGIDNFINARVVNVRESNVNDGTTLGSIISVNADYPNSYYESGVIDNHAINELVSYDSLELTYSIRYKRASVRIFLEYYYGTYPSWSRYASTTINVKYNSDFAEDFSLSDLNIDLNLYKNGQYNNGQVYGEFNTYDDVINAGVIQIYYTPIDFTIEVHYVVGEETTVSTTTINALDFLGEPRLSDVIPIAQNKPEGYQFDPETSYDGDITLEALTQASPITITYVEIQADRTKNIIVRYKKELASAYSTINTSLITISESDWIDGVRLRDIIPLNQYRPEYYAEGIVDGASSTAIMTFDTVGSSYDVLYVATEYLLPVRYYMDEVNILNWIGSSSITYKVISFSIGTTLYDLGLDLNAYKPSYGSDGALQYNGAVNFETLQGLEAVNVVYETISQPDDDIDYPHRFLFLQHNDLGSYEYLHPTWTMNHAYINTGVAVDDMSKLTVVMECDRVDRNEPLYNVNAGYAYLFGSTSPSGQFYMRYQNRHQFTDEASQEDLFQARAGLASVALSLTETQAVGWGLNSGIYQQERPGYSIATFTYSNQLQNESVAMPYPLYLFACNQAGSYTGGLAGIGIYSCRIYYDGNLVRDLIPVETYDLIGTQVAPSNCLYDKVTKTFFEDGTGLNSFNIRDDERYTDDNLAHKIGHCYVQYYKGNNLLKTETIWFRGNDFETPYNPYAKFMVDENQPAYADNGVIENYNNLIFDFEHMKNSVYVVRYAELDTNITVNYYQGETLLASEEIGITEADFYSVPSFGDIVRLNKYKPAGYKTDYTFPEERVTLNRVLSHSPYNIIYVPETNELETYTTNIVYQKKVYGYRNYETIGTIQLTFDQTNFRDGEYIDYYINLNQMKPASYYLDGEPFEWFLMDERLTNPSDLKEQYIINYNPEIQYIDINYYTDEIDAANLVASTTWAISIDEFNPEETFQLADRLPNNYINKYKPGNCAGGVLQNANENYSFGSLVTLGTISIVYESIEEPNDPETAVYQQKILYFGNPWDKYLHMSADEIVHDLGENYGARIPYIDLGYRPKELSRLRIEIKCYTKAYGLYTNATNAFSAYNEDYSAFIGYTGAPNDYKVYDYARGKQLVLQNPLKANQYSAPNYNSKWSKGVFALYPRLPVATDWTYTAFGPQTVDGQTYYRGGDGQGIIHGAPVVAYQGVTACFRNGFSKDTDENYELINVFRTYLLEYNSPFDYNPSDEYATDGYMQDKYTIDHLTDTNALILPLATPMANPLSITLDAFNNYISVYEYGLNNYQYEYIIDNEDEPIFEDIEQPKGSITLFRTTNPTTGKVNIMPWEFDCYKSPGLLYGGYGQSLAFVGVSANPYQTTEEGFSVTFTSYVKKSETTKTKTESSRDKETGEINHSETTSETSVEYIPVKQTVNINFMGYRFPCFPQLESMAVWGIKIYDQDKLVRWLIPVAEGDQIYDYTMPANGLFDLITEIFFGNSNTGGTYSYTTVGGARYVTTITPDRVLPLYCIPDPLVYGKITTNYYDYDNRFLGNQFVDIPTWFNITNTTIEDVLKFNDYKPDDFHLDGLLDIDSDLSFENIKLSDIYEMGTANVFYRLRTYTKTIKYYKSNTYVGSHDIQYNIEDINNAETLADLGIDVDLFYDSKFSHGRIIFNEDVIADDDIAAFINAPSPIVVYDELSKTEAPNLFYVEYYRGGAYDDALITLDENNHNYFNCDLTAKVLNPSGAIQYDNHYHSALYANETYDYFVPYVVKVNNHYTGIHSGPGRIYPVLANIVVADTYTIIAERNGWGKLREYNNGWILLNQTTAITGPGQNPDYTVAEATVATIPYATEISITQLTVDRLWAYADEYECWIKTEDISYDQSGKLYNALGITVINLDEDVDWANATQNSDVFDSEAYKLRFHNNSGFTRNWAMTKEAWANQHSIEICYPETIYNYTCIYYKDNKAAANELGRSAFSCTISDWNPDWDTFISTSWQVDENDDPIAPTLYRDTPITLDWSYFGFERNTFKPTGYYDGIYLWNPRTWDKKNIRFTFEELIRCGTQYVVYPIFDPEHYKIWVQRNYIGQYAQWRSGAGTTSSPYQWRHRIALNPGVEVNLAAAGQTNLFYAYEDEDYNAYDIYASGELKNDMYSPYHSANFFSNTPVDLSDSTQYHLRLWGNMRGQRLNTITRYYESIFNKQSDNFGAENEDVIITNWSNHRNSPNIVIGYGNVIEGNENKYFIPIGSDFENWVEIKNNTNLNSYHILSNTAHNGNTVDTYKLSIDTGYKTVQDFSQNNLNTYQYNTPMYGVIYDIMSYYNFEMIHYWIPVPKGMWYRYNGEDLRIPDNGLFDLLTGDFVCSYRTTDGALTTTVDSSWVGTLRDGNDYIYNRNDHIGLVAPINLFDDWTPTENECNYIVQLNNNVTSHRKPDAYDTVVNNLLAGLVLPISRYTSDAANQVVGEWYYSSGQWFESNNASIYAGQFDTHNLERDYKEFSLVPGSHNSFDVYLNPEETSSADASYGSSAVILQNYYTYTVGGVKYYFDGRFWIPEEYTSFNRVESNTNWVVSRTTNYYSFPLEGDNYKAGQYLYGDRVTILYTAANDTNWGFTGQGWVQIENNLSEVL